MRLFIALDMPAKVKDTFFEIQKQVKDAKITWVAKKHLHLTLKFLGEVEENKIEEIKSALQIKFSKFKVSTGKIGFFPNSNNPRIIWVSINPEEKVIALQQKVDEALLTIVPTEQQFKSHVTLGRIKQIRRKKDFLASISEIKIENIEFEISSFQLVKSELTRSGPMYEVLENVSLS